MGQPRSTEMEWKDVVIVGNHRNSSEDESDGNKESDISADEVVDLRNERISKDFARQPFSTSSNHQHHRTKSKDVDGDPITAVTTREEFPTSAHGFFKHENLTATNTTVYSESKSLTNKNVNLMDHLSIVIGPPVILILDLVVPCAIYYSWLHIERKKWRQGGMLGPKPVYNEHILGLSIISFGFGELYILIVRIVRLIKDWEGCAPLLSKHKWELDATCWVYGSALLVALIPFTVATTARNEVIPWLYLWSPGFLMAFLGLVAVVTLIPIKIPVRINSDPKGSRMKPIVYYAAEDFISVDNFQGRAFRKRFRQRYEANPRIRRMILHLTLFWIGGICMYNGLIAAIVFNLEFEYAWGTSLGVLFAWILSWAGTTFLWVRRIVDREKNNARQEKAKRLSAIMEERLSMMIEDANRGQPEAV
ncbi:uncharacterized protein PV09_05388 [Verruconis gallopava]|uniref:Uncharacterized protein n=1 Tax=Verruconis gallopava TaxID=253628 RepID=A0A0D2AA58_9PEZI|nr:uncharacterized protein PV09_05388 [Verruconis gallopava]KIW03638.1 hypothetical protein PV09_05388 [Verruconis gallopava]